MEFFGGSYLFRLIIALLAVVVVPYIASKIIMAWSRAHKQAYQSGEAADLSTLIQREIRRLGSRGRGSPVGRGRQRPHSRHDGRVMHIYQTKIKALQQENPNNSELKDLTKSVKLFAAATNGHLPYFKHLSDAINQMTKSQTPPRDIANATKSLLTEKVFILSQEQREVMGHSEVKNLIAARTILDAFIQDARLESSTVCKAIEKGKNKSPHEVYLAIHLLLLLKSGAAKRGLYQMAVERPEAIRTKFKQLSSTQVNNAILSLLRTHKGQYILADQVSQIIYRQLHEFDQFKEDFIGQKSRQQEQKRKRHGQQSFTSWGPLGEYYEILGCRQSDSTAMIKRRYRKLALKNHPDRVQALAPESADGAHEEFVKIQQAYGEIIKSRKEAA